ncbi:hypothetical protein [Streptomyces griseorubiginosus]
MTADHRGRRRTTDFDHGDHTIALNQGDRMGDRMTDSHRSAA